jgi:hypothetical protein
MIVRRLCLASALLLLLTLALPLLASAEDTGTVRGKLENVTVQGKSVAGSVVELIAYDGQTQKAVLSTTAAADGTFEFSNLPMTGQKYILTTVFDNVRYYGDEIDLAAGPAEYQAELRVFDATEDDTDITISRSHMIVDIDPGNKMLIMLEAFVVTNRGDRAFVGSKGDSADPSARETLRLRLPEGAMHVRFNDGLLEDQASVVDGVLVDTMPVIPGSRQVVINYFIPYEENAAGVKRALDYGVAQTSIVIKDVGEEISFEGLVQKEALNISGKRYVHLTAENVEPGKELSFRLANIPATLPAEPSSTTGAASTQPPVGLWWAAAGLGALGVVLGLSYPVLRRRRRMVDQATGSADLSGAAYERIVEEIAQIDEDFETGKVAEEDYVRLRAEKKASLRKRGRRSGNR